jgi:hypothetical protein
MQSGLFEGLQQRRILFYENQMWHGSSLSLRVTNAGVQKNKKEPEMDQTPFNMLTIIEFTQ